MKSLLQTFGLVAWLQVTFVVGKQENSLLTLASELKPIMFPQVEQLSQSMVDNITPHVNALVDIAGDNALKAIFATFADLCNNYHKSTKQDEPEAAKETQEKPTQETPTQETPTTQTQSEDNTNQSQAAATKKRGRVELPNQVKLLEENRQYNIRASPETTVRLKKQNSKILVTINKAGETIEKEYSINQYGEWNVRQFIEKITK